MSENKSYKSVKKPSNHICAALLAHVDAGKTTLAESILYHTGSIRKMGRVDHRDTFLDTYGMERTRGITIFSKQAVFTLGDKEITLVDTPGHVDFSAEMERTLQILDYAVLIISGADGVQGHTQTLWKLLCQYKIPTFLFINKMDQEGTDRGEILAEFKSRLSSGCMDFGNAGISFEKVQNREEFLEELALCDEEVLEQYLETGGIEDASVRRMIKERRVFPCYFGSALKSQGVEAF